MDRVFRGGVPYAIDVKRLLEAFPVPSLAEGRVIDHSQLEELLGVPKGHQRYYGVVNSWIAQMKSSNGIFIVWEPAVGLKVLGPAEILTFAEGKTRQKIRQTGRAIGTLRWVDRERLDTMGQRRFDHERRATSLLMDALQVARKDLAIDLAPIASLPKPKLIRGA